VRGSITADSPRDPIYDDLAELYTFEGSSGDEIRITQRSDAFDPYVVLTRPDDSVVAEQDDGGGGFDTQFTITLPEDGEYHIWAGSLSGEARGTFTLTLEEDPPEASGASEDAAASWDGPPASASSIPYGQQVEGTITESSPRDPVWNDLSAAYTFQGSSGDSVRITMRSDTFDPFVVLSGPDGSTVHQQDDGGGSFDSQFTLTLPTDGRYTIWAGSLSGDATGSFTLSVERV
jgi:hypothetical protein